MPGKSVFGFVFLCIVQGIVDHAKTSSFATSKVSPKAKYKDHIWGSLVHFGQLLPDFSLWDSGFSRMKDIYDHLLPLKQSVAHKLLTKKNYLQYAHKL